MDKQLKDCANQYGFYDPLSKQFYVIPAQSQEEFKSFLECFKALSNTPDSASQDSLEEKFDDFDFLVEEVSKTPDSPLSQHLIEFDI